ncbi:hypothetical protein RLIN73S_02756 [Rhodanobacter lindaniclasticus]
MTHEGRSARLQRVLPDALPRLTCCCTSTGSALAAATTMLCALPVAAWLALSVATGVKS